MIIRKLFKFEGAHIVRNCSSDRCKKSIHGHSYVVEVFLEGGRLDNGQMVVDFGLLKGPIKDFIDSFDHAYSMWNREVLNYKDFMYNNSDRVVEMPVSPSAEGYSLLFAYVISKIISNTKFVNGEDSNLSLHKVRVHETTTGYAEAYKSDVQNLVNFTLKDINFTPAIIQDWSNKNMILDLLTNKPFVNPYVTLTH